MGLGQRDKYRLSEAFQGQLGLEVDGIGFNRLGRMCTKVWPFKAPGPLLELQSLGCVVAGPGGKTVWSSLS